jgi:hypothetical protein
MEAADSLLHFHPILKTELVPQIPVLWSASRVLLEDDPSQQGVVLPDDAI